MAKVEKRKARKDYPESGVSKGDEYYYTKIKTGPRSSRVMRSKTPFKPSQLTSSEYLQQVFSVREAWETSQKDADAVADAADGLREAGEGARERFDNMPEGLQQGERGQQLEERAEGCEAAADVLDDVAARFAGLEEPDPANFTLPEDENGDATDEEGRTYEDAMIEYEQEKSDLIDEAEEAIGDVPE